MRISDWSSDVCSADLRPHPFIPHPLQRARALPHASAERELAYAKTQLDGWRRRSGSVVLSHAAAEAGTELAPSPLLAPWLDRIERLDVDGLPQSRSEEHTSELQSLMRISYAVFCLQK